MPKSAVYTLLWSAEQHRYGLFAQHNRDVPVLGGDDDAWFGWLASHSSFSFHGQHGSLSFQKEERPRGKEAYWYAYRRQGKRMVKKYAGRSADLSMAHLEAVAQALGLQTHQEQMTHTGSLERSRRPKQRTPFAHQAEVREEESKALQETAFQLISALEQQHVLLLPKLHPHSGKQHADRREPTQTWRGAGPARSGCRALE